MKYTDKIVKLVEAVDVKLSGEDNEETKDFLLAQFNKLPAYFTAVIEGNVRLAIMGGEGHFDPVKVRDIEVKRREAHINVCGAINSINRLSKLYMGEIFFEFPEIDNRPLDPGTLSKSTDQNNMDREAAALRVYGFCKMMFLEGPDLSRYNKFEHYSEKDMDREMQSMSEQRRPVEFRPKKTVNELLRAARSYNNGQNDRESIHGILSKGDKAHE